MNLCTLKEHNISFNLKLLLSADSKATKKILLGHKTRGGSFKRIIALEMNNLGFWYSSTHTIFHLKVQDQKQQAWACMITHCSITSQDLG